jgi:hypothetical protein
MNIFIVLLRLIHIVAAFAWFGLALTALLFVLPAVQASGEAGWRFSKALYTRTRFGMVMIASAGITVLAGILLYLTRDPEQNFSQTGQIVLGIGAVIGVLAAGHARFATEPAISKIAKLTASSVSDTAAITPEASKQLEAENAKVRLHIRLNFGMTAVALLFMATARYL